MNKASGPDNISGRILKECSREISPSLTVLFNLSLTLGKMPENWKLANVSPIFKKGERENCCNYRPISLLMYSKQGVRTSCTKPNQIWNSVLDCSGQTDIIYLDFSKAFDSVPHYLLLHKLRSFGFNGSLYKWLCSYVNNRKQRVVINGEHTEWCSVTSGCHRDLY